VTYNSTVPLIAYHQKNKIAATANLLSGDIEMPKDATNASEPVDETFYPHLKREINLHVVTDSSVYPNIEAIPW